MKGVVALQTSITRYIAQKTLPKDSNIKQKIITASSLANKQTHTNSSSIATAPSTINSGSPPPISKVTSPASSLSASLSANAKLPSGAEVTTDSATIDGVVGDKKPDTRLMNGPATVNGPSMVNRTSSPKAGSFTTVKPDLSGKNTIVVKDAHLMNHGTRLKFPDGSVAGVHTDIKVGYVQQSQQHAEATNGPTTLNGGKYTNNTLSKSGATASTNKVITNVASPKVNNMTSHPTMKIVTQHSPNVKPVVTVGRVSSGTVISGVSSHGKLPSTAG